MIGKKTKDVGSLAVIGRPRAFDLDEALDSALTVFWRKGYDGTSISDLTEAMGINPPSLYAAFGNKEKLFRKALDRYAEGRAGYWNRALEAPTARSMVEELLRGTADFLTDKDNPPGCMFVQGALCCGEETDTIRRELNARREAGEVAIRERLKRAKAEGELPADANPSDLARYVGMLLEGMSVQAAAGASRAELRRIVDMALRTWPAR